MRTRIELVSLDAWSNWYPDPVPPAGLLPPYVPSGSVDFIDVPGPPAQDPPTSFAHIVVDSDGRQWQYFNGAWN